MTQADPVSLGREDEMAAPVLVVGCGRRDCGHDALGPQVADRIASLDLPGVSLLIEETPSVDLVDLLGERASTNPLRLLVIVDAASASLENPIGTWIRIDYHQQPEALCSRVPVGTHQFGVPEILELGRTLKVLPSQVWIYAGFGEGFELSSSTPEVTLELAGVLADVVACDVCRFLAAEQGDR